MRKIERGATRLWAWQASNDPDDLSFAIFDNAGTLVSSVTATQSGTGAWYAIASVPNSPAYFNTKWLAWASSKEYPTDELIKVIDVEADLGVPSYYCSNADVRNKLDALNASGKNLVNDTIQDGIEDSMSLIDSHLVRNYTLPFSSTPKFVKKLCRDLTVFEIARRYVPRNDEGQMQEFLVDMRDEAIDALEALAVGSQYMVTDSGTIWDTLMPSALDTGAIKTIRQDGVRMTFTELDSDAQRQDPDNIKNIADETFDD